MFGGAGVLMAIEGNALEDATEDGTDCGVVIIGVETGTVAGVVFTGVVTGTVVGLVITGVVTGTEAGVVDVANIDAISR